MLLSSWELARDYGFTDYDGRRPDWGRHKIDFSVLPPDVDRSVPHGHRPGDPVVDDARGAGQEVQGKDPVLTVRNLHRLAEAPRPCRRPSLKTMVFAPIEHREHTKMKPKNTICLWFDKDAHEAARFYAATFPNSEVTAVHKAPGDYPSGKAGDVLTVEFTVLGIPCLGLNGGPSVQAQRGVLLPDRHGRSGRDGPLLECDRRQWRPGKRVRLVQGPLGPLLADHAARADRRAGGRRR